MLMMRDVPSVGRARQRLFIGGMIISAAWLAGSVPARADDCATIFKAFEALTGVPAYSQTVTMKDAGSLRSVVIGDVMYANDGSKWMKIPLKAGGRRGMLKQFVPDGTHLKDCARVGSDTIGGAAMTVYSYVPPVPKGMEAFAAAGGAQKLWVGVSDGLPRRMTTDSMEMTISFDAVTAPIP